MSENIKVRDAKYGETGWAVLKNGKVYLDNTFKNVAYNTELILKKDGYTIDLEATNQLKAKKEYDREQQELLEEHDRIVFIYNKFKKYIGTMVTTRRGTGKVVSYDKDKKSFRVDFYNGDTVYWNFATMTSKF